MVSPLPKVWLKRTQKDICGGSCKVGTIMVFAMEATWVEKREWSEVQYKELASFA